jgi:hypothetical protein
MIQQPSPVPDDAYVEVEYIHPNRGQHQVTGAATGEKYGQRAGGERFLVRRDDIAAQPQFFRIIELEKVAPPEPTAVVIPPPPEPIPVAPQPEEIPTASVPRDLLEGAEEVTQTEDQPAPEKKPIGEFDELDLSIIPGITPAIGKQMRTIGLTTPRAIMDSGIDGLQELKGVGSIRAQGIVEYVANLVGL